MSEARDSFAKALGLVQLPSERVFLHRRIDECANGTTA
jgi:predicted RNA polymerase sigma factor